MGDVAGGAPPELVAVKSITSIGNRERWEFALPLEYMHKDGQVITRFNPDAEAPASRPPERGQACNHGVGKGYAGPHQRKPRRIPRGRAPVLA